MLPISTLRCNGNSFSYFRQKWAKENVEWLHSGEAVQYEPKKWYFFRRDLSVGPQHDKFTLPNVPMIVSRTTFDHITEGIGYCHSFVSQ